MLQTMAIQLLAPHTASFETEEMDTGTTSWNSSRTSPEPLETIVPAMRTPSSWTRFSTDPTPLPQNLTLKQLREMTSTEMDKLNAVLASTSPARTLLWLLDLELGHVVQFTSFGLSGMVITDIMSKIGSDVPILFVDTLHHFDEVRLDLLLTSSNVLYTHTMCDRHWRFAHVLRRYTSAPSAPMARRQQQHDQSLRSSMAKVHHFFFFLSCCHMTPT